MTTEEKQVVVILPMSSGLKTAPRCLLQLRDFKDGIVFPGLWGFFGGSVLKGEPIEEAAYRELFEETGIVPSTLHLIGTDRIEDLDNLLSHAFWFELDSIPDSAKLREGCDWDWFTSEEVRLGELHSSRFQKTFPIVPTNYIPNMISLAERAVKNI